MMVPCWCRIALIGLVLGAAPAPAADPWAITPAMIRDAAPPAGLEVIRLPLDEAARAAAPKEGEQWYWIRDQFAVRNVVQPDLTVVAPAPGTATGTAVIIAPGGSFNFLSWSNEGLPVAQMLARRGVTAFILKYRTRATPRTRAGLATFLTESNAEGLKARRRFKPVPIEVLEDAGAAVHYVRRNAARWKLDPKRIGFLGFSAGATAGLALATAERGADRPDFAGLLYGPLMPRSVPKSPPPLFAARALDDPFYGPLDSATDENFGLLSAWRASGGSVDFHLYSGGGHGFGMQAKGTTSDQWKDQFLKWMEIRGLLRRPAPRP